MTQTDVIRRFPRDLNDSRLAFACSKCGAEPGHRCIRKMHLWYDVAIEQVPSQTHRPRRKLLWEKYWREKMQGLGISMSDFVKDQLRRRYG